MHMVTEALAAGLERHRAGDAAAASEAYRAVLDQVPDQPTALRLYGVLLAAHGDPAEAEAVLRRALWGQPGDAGARFALGNLRHRAGDATDAAALWQGVLDAEPGHPGATLNLAGQARAAGAWMEAVDLLRAALALSPTRADLWTSLAASLLAGQADTAALTAADAALELDPLLAEAWLVRGTVLSRQRQPNAAMVALRQALRLQPDLARAELHLGNTLLDMDQTEAAAAHLVRAVALAPDLAEAQTSLGFCEASQHRLQAAIASHRRALTLQPDFATAHSNLAAALLLSGDYENGFAAYEWRKRLPRFSHGCWRSDRPEWAGESLTGRTILVFCEQGFGDSLMCARYLPVLAGRGARIVLVCAAPLIPLLGRMAGVAAVVRRGDPLQRALLAPGEVAPGYDVWIDQMSLPRVLGTGPERICGAAGYLVADPGIIDAWRPRLPAGLKVGLAWAGNPMHGNDRRRSLRLQDLAPVRAVRGVEWVSLQCGAGAVQGGPSGLHDCSAGLTDYAQTAALIECLDLVISVDTSVAHLAGAMGRPCWLLLPHVPDWRWRLERTGSPWYESLRLFRQVRPGDWAGVVQAVAVALRAWRGSSMGTVPRSLHGGAAKPCDADGCHGVDTFGTGH